METTTINIDWAEVNEKIFDSPSGAFSVFVKLNDKVGLKLFETEEERDFAYNYQKEAAHFELGPDVYGTVDDCNVNMEYTEWDPYRMPMEEDEFYEDYQGLWLEEYPYGYLSEIVETIDSFNDPEEFESFVTLFKNESENLCYELENKTGFMFLDCHNRNVGIKNGKLVCIDFGDC